MYSVRSLITVISRIVRMLHSASLMVDNIQDDAQLRRGQPVAHRIYGVPKTINAVNYVYFLAYEELAALRPRIRGDGSDCGEQGFGFGDYRGVAVASSGTGSRNILATLRGVPLKKSTSPW